MPKQQQLSYATVELGGVTYAVVREAQLLALCQRAGVSATAHARGEAGPAGPLEYEPQTLAARVRQRRQAAGLTQAALAASAGIRAETLNRIERGKTEPDYRTIRKLVVALKQIEAQT